jgi:glycosyltransferase involved in cell wall biosynthesis
MHTYIIRPLLAALGTHSGIHRLGHYADAEDIVFEPLWNRLSRRSWTAGDWVRRVGVKWTGSGLSQWCPLLDERQVLRQLRGKPPGIAHFIWGEMTTPVWPSLYRRRGFVPVANMHATDWRRERMLKGYRGYHAFERIILVSECQRDGILASGYPADRLHVIPHGIDADFFCPPEVFEPVPGQALQALLVGTTERDHHFMAEILKILPQESIQLNVVTMAGDASVYREFKNVTLIPRVDDEELRELYRKADILVMPMIDCTANNAILEAMACGTPVMANRVGGIPEYLDPATCIMTEGKNVKEWRDQLVALGEQKEKLWQIRAAVRHWAEQFRWQIVASHYREVYQLAMTEQL